MREPQRRKHTELVRCVHEERPVSSSGQPDDRSAWVVRSARQHQVAEIRRSCCSVAHTSQAASLEANEATKAAAVRQYERRFMNINNSQVKPHVSMQRS